LRRTSLVYVLIPAILVATVGLAYYSIRTSRELEQKGRRSRLDTQKELAEEKILGIEDGIELAENTLFDAFDQDNLPQLQESLATVALQTVTVLDRDLRRVASGYYTKDDSQIDYPEMVDREVIPRLRTEIDPGPHARGRMHFVIGGQDYLFGYKRRGRFVVLVEYDILHLLATVCPQYFPVDSRSAYQVVDETRQLRCGTAFDRIPEQAVTELPFRNTLPRWKLRVAPKTVVDLKEQEREQNVIDVFLVTLAFTVIIAGSAGLVVTARRERRLSEMKSDFISNVSHELKTPLSIISMFGELLAMGRVSSPEKAAEYAEIIRRESVRLSRLIDNVLDLAKIERGVEFYEFTENEDIGDVVTRAIEISRPRLERADMELDLVVEPDLPLVRLDANAMALAVLNLIDNAIKYAVDGKRIEVVVRAKADGVELEVKDHGPGIPPSEQDHVFERFYRVRRGQKKPIRGSGIGLSLVKHIAEAHGGAVTVSCGQGFGSSFRLWIPAGSDKG
jgi:two-component system phosphate regulon sensor histidine kinase PhoR